MKNRTIKLCRLVCITLGLLLLANNTMAQTTVTTLGGGNPNVSPKYLGYTNGITLSQALFHTPSGIAYDSYYNCLYVADRDNNAIRMLDLAEGQTFTIFPNTNTDVPTNLISRPVGVDVDSYGDIFVLNRGSTNSFSTNGTVMEFDSTYFTVVATNATKLTNAAGMALDRAGDIYVTVKSNSVIQIAPNGVITTIVTITNAGTFLQGIIVKQNGLLAVSDYGRNGIYLINPTNGVVTTNCGFNGAGDYTGSDNRGAANPYAKFFQPTSLAEAGDGSLIVVDTGNNRVKVISPIGVVTNLYGVASNYWGGTYPGWYDGTVKVPDSVTPNVQSRLPFGMVFASDGSLYTTEDYYHLIRKVTSTGLPLPPPPPPEDPIVWNITTNYGQIVLSWYSVPGATNYNVKRSNSTGGPYTVIAQTTALTYTDTNVVNGTTYYYVISASNTGGEGPNSAEVSATPPIQPPPAPIIGWYDFEANTQTVFLSVIHSVSGGNPYVANNPLPIAINPTITGISTYYITIPPYTNNTSIATLTNNGSTAPVYLDGQPFGSTKVNPLPTLTLSNGLVTIEAVNVNGVGEPSPIASAEFLFQVGTPTIAGNNAAQFTLSDVTSNVVYYYTLDGSDPTNAPLTQQIVSTNGTTTVSLNGNTNIFFQVRAFGYGPESGYAASGIAQQNFVTGAFVPNTISFGFASGEASSDFVGAPGQTFYAPVTLSVLPNTLIYSLQFNITVTNLGADAITPGAFDFQSMLEEPGQATNTSETVYYRIPPLMYAAYSANVPPSQLVTNNVGQVFVNLDVTNTSLNLLAVGWVEHYGNTNLYNTLSQDLIEYSQAHDDLFPNPKQPNGVIVGGYGFQIPVNAQPGEQYQIQIGRPTATSDGIGTPGSSVYINTPTNGSLAGGAINSIKVVTAGQRMYLAGNAYPFRWFNAGDFGNTNLQNADVEQVFESAAYGWNTPPNNTDFYDCMDSSGCYGVYDSTHGYYTNAGPLSLSDQLALYNSTDPTVLNSNMFGDTNLDVSDVFVTYIRSVDPSLNWIQRFWTNGVRAAMPVGNVFNPSLVSKTSSVTSKAIQTTTPSISITNLPKVNFTASDIQGSAGQVVQIPIYANVFGSYPLRVLMLNLSVVPLDGSPALASAVQFAANPVLGQPYTTDSSGNGNYAAVWLNNTNSGLTGNALVGTLTVTIPTNANINAAYAVHFDHASGSPNGFASFPKQTLTGLITLSSRTNSTYGDGIPDSWRLRYFGTVNNLLSQTNADADGDGENNWQEYVAGTDPTDPTSVFKNIGTDQGAAQQSSDCVIHWPSVSGKQYIIQRSTKLFPPTWSPISTNSGTGTEMEFHDTSGGGVRFYRVSVQ